MTVKQTFRSSALAAWIFSHPAWKITLDSQVTLARAGEATRIIHYLEIHQLKIKRGMIWARIHIQLINEKIVLSGIQNSKAEFFAQTINKQINQNLNEVLKVHSAKISELATQVKHLLSHSRYVSNYDIRSCLQRESDENALILRAIIYPKLSHMTISRNLQSACRYLQGILREDQSAIKAHNAEFVSQQLTAYQAFFDTVESTPLTEEQRRAVIIMEDRNLLIAAAGSGKTSVLVSKVGYVLQRGIVNPENVLLLAFNQHAVHELEQRVAKRLRQILNGKTVAIKTFHAMGLDIIAEVDQIKPSVPDFAIGQGSQATSALQEIINSLILKDVEFASDWLTFRALFMLPPRDPSGFKTMAEWNAYVKETGNYANGKTGYQTLNGELVKSQGELAIANWLYLNNVKYEYEKPYQYPTANQHYRQYHPDFYFPNIDCYLEHYAFDANGKAPPAFGDKYIQSAEWKRVLHRKHGTDIFETTFAEFVSGKLFEKLTQELTRRGVVLQPISVDSALETINTLQGTQTNELLGLIQTFLKHTKSNRLVVQTLMDRAQKSNQGLRATVFIRMITSILKAYTKKLEAGAYVDFEDMMIKATDHIAQGRYTHPYQLILVDEFQDISQARAQLIQAMLLQAPACKLFAVGDDWQSIYRFSGADISLFTHFEEQFGVTNKQYLTRTFRSNQGIADTAATFIQKNPEQMTKTVIAQDLTRECVIKIQKLASREETDVQILVCLDEVRQLVQVPKEASVFILGRYRFQRPNNLEFWQRKFKGVLNIEFKTMHASKGLQTDYVIVIGLQAGKIGFPSLIADDPLLDLVLPMPEQFEHAEERRLFYVALTRAKKGVYLLAHQFLPSTFIEEIQNDKAFMTIIQKNSHVTENHQNHEERCPSCQSGYLRPRTGKFGPFLGCSRYPKCHYTKNSVTG